MNHQPRLEERRGLRPEQNQLRRLLGPIQNEVAPEERAAELATRRRLKMSRSPQAFVRGTTEHFYRWLAAQPGPDVPQGPCVWICGDCHYGNFGPLASAEGEVQIALRDFDQAVLGNPAFDLVRLALSLATAIRDCALSGVTIVSMTEEMACAYQDAFLKQGAAEPAPKCVRGALQAAYRRNWEKLAQERVDGPKWYFPRGKRFWDLAKTERDGIARLFDDRELLGVIFGEEIGDAASCKIEDAAYWVKGCSSLGLLRVAILLRHDAGGPAVWRLIDIKEAIEPIAPRVEEQPLCEGEASRVVSAARVLAPNLGARMAARRLLGRSVFIRELLPQDLKLEITSLTPQQAIKAARYLAATLGRAHADQMTDDDRREWGRELGRGRQGDLDAPNWLWRSVVTLMTIHQAAYLEHCRKVALDLLARRG